MGSHSAKTNSVGTKFAATTIAFGAAAALMAPTAAAAPDSDWDRLAQCESGGNWHINTGNGYTEVCSSLLPLGRHLAAASSLRPQTRHLAKSRSSLQSAPWPSRVGAHGQLAPQAWA